MARAGKSHKRMVVDRSTGLYLKEDGTWTAEEGEAIDFADIATVVRVCAKHHVTDADVLLRFDSAQKFDVRIPLQK
jgi:hypothetical protein